MKSYQIIAIIFAVLALLWVGSGFIAPSAKDEPSVETAETQDKKALPQVRVREFKAQTYTDNIVVTGRSQASKRVEIKAETTGAITYLLKE